MNINENIRNERKLVKKIEGYTYKITTTPAANYLIPKDFVPNKSWDKAIWLKWSNMWII